MACEGFRIRRGWVTGRAKHPADHNVEDVQRKHLVVQLNVGACLHLKECYNFRSAKRTRSSMSDPRPDIGQLRFITTVTTESVRTECRPKIGYKRDDFSPRCGLAPLSSLKRRTRFQRPCGMSQPTRLCLCPAGSGSSGTER